MSIAVSRRLSMFLAAAVIAPGSPATARTAATTQQATTNGWGVALTDVTPDPAIRYGKLANGMRYAIRRGAVPKGAGALRLQFEFGSIVAPDKADEVDMAIAAVTRTLRTAPVSADLLDRARQPMLENAAKSLRQNGYWLGLVGEAQTDAAKLDRPRTRDTVIRSITAAELQALAAEYLRDDRLQRVRIVSDKVAGKATAPR